MKLIKQTSRFGCASAVIAMVAECTVEKAEELLGRNETYLMNGAGPTPDGHSLPAIAMTLIELGWMTGVVIERSHPSKVISGALEGLELPITLSVGHTCLLLDKAHRHMMLLKDGEVCDPSRVAADFQIDQIIPLTEFFI